MLESARSIRPMLKVMGVLQRQKPERRRRAASFNVQRALTTAMQNSDQTSGNVYIDSDTAAHSLGFAQVLHGAGQSMLTVSSMYQTSMSNAVANRAVSYSSYLFRGLGKRVALMLQWE